MSEPIILNGKQLSKIMEAELAQRVSVIKENNI